MDIASGICISAIGNPQFPERMRQEIGGSFLWSRHVSKRTLAIQPRVNRASPAQICAERISRQSLEDH